MARYLLPSWLPIPTVHNSPLRTQTLSSGLEINTHKRDLPVEDAKYINYSSVTSREYYGSRGHGTSAHLPILLAKAPLHPDHRLGRKDARKPPPAAIFTHISIPRHLRLISTRTPRFHDRSWKPRFCLAFRRHLLLSLIIASFTIAACNSET